MSVDFSSITKPFKSIWYELSLARQFVLVSSIILFLGMIVMGIWVANKIEAGVTQNTASATALYMDSFIAPIVQELADKKDLSKESQRTLNTLFNNTLEKNGIVSLKIWAKDSRLVYSNHSSIIGETFPMTSHLAEAWEGVVAAEFDNLIDEEDRHERKAGLPLLEMFSPVRDAQSGRIIAVAEFYEDATKLERELFFIKLESWFLVAMVTIVTLGLLSGIVRRGSRTIDRQRKVLEDRVEQLSQLLLQNEELRRRAQQSSLRATEVNEHFLRRISADLHDGPAQLIGLGLLHLDALSSLIEQLPDQDSLQKRDLETVRSALGDALDEIRSLSAGLSLPELQNLSLRKTLEKAVQMHQFHTKTQVQCSYDGLPAGVSMPFKISAYRFVQEALANAFLHGKAKDQRIEARYDASDLEIVVSDQGPGFDPSLLGMGDGLGLLGLRERIESLGGSFEVRSAINEGTQVIAHVPFKISEWKDDGQNSRRLGR